MALPIRNLQEYEQSILQKALAKLKAVDTRRTSSAVVSQAKMALLFLSYIDVSHPVLIFHNRQDWVISAAEISNFNGEEKKQLVVYELKKLIKEIEALSIKLRSSKQ